MLNAFAPMRDGVLPRALAAGWLALWLLTLAGGWHKLSGETAAVRENPEFPARPFNKAITRAQSAFWDYIEAFHRLPDYPTDLQSRIFATRGDAKHFQFISTSPTSVLANVAGMKARRERFAKCYPWVKKLLENENITLDVDESVFQGSAEEIVSKH